MTKCQFYSQFETLRDAKDWVMATRGLTDRQAEKWLRDKVPLESDYQKEIIKWISKSLPGAFAWKATQGAYSRSGIPDICAVINGKFYGFEVKRPFFGEPSEMQKLVIKQINEAGGHAHIVSYIKEVAEILLPELGTGGWVWK